MDIINKEKILELAKKLVSEGKFDRAIVEYEKIVQLDSSDLRVKIKIAELYVKRKQIQSAIRIYEEVANGYADGGFYLKAVTVYKSILRLNPSLIDVNTALSELYEKMGLIQDALYQYQIVASALEQKGDHAGMLSIRERMTALDPANVPMRIRLAETYQIQGMTDKAIDMYEALAEQLKDSGDISQLMELYSKILAHRPEKHELVRKLCHMYFKRGEWKEILKRMDIAKEFISKDPELLAMQADIYTRLNQIETAKGKYKDLAVLLVEQGDVESALKAYENILFLSPENEEDIVKEVEDIREGGFAVVKAGVEKRRKKAADEEKKKEEESRFQQEAMLKTEEIAKKLGVAPDEISVSSNDAVKIEKEADSNYDLGAMYKKMGLLEEAKAEFLKALKGYERLAVGGFANEKSAKRLSELETMFPEKRVETKPKIEKKEKPEPKKEIKNQNKKKISFV